MTERLLPCPFCGSTHIYVLPEHGTGRSGAVGCEDCQTLGPTLYKASDTVAAWNRRASRWISVEERLPEEGERVLLLTVADRADDLRIKFGSRRDDPTFPWYHQVEADGYETGLCDDVTHWMPLPESPPLARTEGGRIPPAAPRHGEDHRG